MAAKITETNLSHNWYLQGLLCKLYWRTIHGSWWKPIERYSWTKTVKEPEQSTRKIASIFCSWRWKSGTRERRATLLFGPSTLKTEIKSVVLSISQPHLAVLHLDHEGGLVRVGGLDEHHQVAVEGAAWDLQLLQIILLGGELVSLSQEQKICQVFLSTPRIRQPVWKTFIRDFSSKVSAEWVGLVTEAILDFKSTSRSRLIWEREEFQPNV